MDDVQAHLRVLPKELLSEGWEDPRNHDLRATNSQLASVGVGRASSCFMPCRNSSKTVTPHLSRAWPYVVSSTPWALRSNKRTPKLCSRSEIVLETTGCVMARRSEAFAMLPDSATASRT